MALASGFTTVCAPTQYRKFSIQSLFLHHVGNGAEEEHVVHKDLKYGHTIIHDSVIFDGPGNGAKLVARALGLHYNAKTKWCHSFSILFEAGSFKGSSLQIMGVPEHEKGEWSIVGGTGQFVMASGIINRILHKMVPHAYVDELIIEGFCPVLDESKSAVHITKIGSWGGTKGTPVDVDDKPPQHLQSVTISYCKLAINSLAYDYIDNDDAVQHVGPWGGTGETTRTIKLRPSEHVKEISGKIDVVEGEKVVTSIMFVTNFGAHGPYGPATGADCFSIKAHKKSVVGFFVRHGAYINAIGVYISKTNTN